MVDSGSTARLILINRCRVSTDQPRPTSSPGARKLGTVRPFVCPATAWSIREKVGGDRLRQTRHREHAQGEEDVGLVEVSGGPVPGVAVGERAAEVPDLHGGQRRTGCRPQRRRSADRSPRH